MKGIKPFKLGMLTRPFQWGAKHQLGVTVLAYFPFAPADTLLTDMELWTVIGDVLDPPVLDVGVPKSRAEFLVAGTAHTPDGLPRTTLPVTVRVGAMEKTLSVIGDRTWNNGVQSAPAEFTQMPLTWEHAFGGEGFDNNPLGRGFAPVTDEAGQERWPLPNVEHKSRLIRSPKDRPEPASLGRVDFTWPQRMGLAGTYDQKWLDTRYPGFAEDMDWRIWNMAPEDQRQDAPFRGDEPLVFENLHPTKPRLEARLPNVRARSFVTKRLAGGQEEFEEVELRLMTLWLFPGIERGVLVFQGATPVREDDATDIIHLMVAGERPGAPRPIEHYQEVLRKRLEPNSALELLNDEDLMPADLCGMGGEIDRVMEMTQPEELRRKRQRKRAEAEILESREKVAALGLDPDEHAASPLPPEEPPVPLGELPDVVRKQLEEMEKMRVDAEKMRRERDAATEKFFEEVGLDYDVIREEVKTVPTGPPDFKADDYVAMMRKMADDAAASGHPSAELENYATDPEFRAKLDAYEDMALQGYRMGAHFQPAAPLGDEIDNALRREEVERKIAAEESFADVDLTGADLSGMDLSNADFALALMESVRFNDANLSGARFDGAVLAHADLSGAKVRGASFRGANLGKAKMRGVDSGGEVDLREAQLYGADLSGAALVGADLTGAIMLETDLRQSDLSRAVMPKVFMVKVPMQGARFTGANCNYTVFMEVDASRIDFGGANLEEAVFLKSRAQEASFLNANMHNFRFIESAAEKADFRGAVITKANFRGAKLDECDFSGATLSGSDMSEAKLSGARLYRVVAKGAFFMKTDLRDAQLVSADLFEAMLTKADIRGADLRHSNLFGADFALVHSDRKTNVEGAIQLKVRTKPVRPNEEGS